MSIATVQFTATRYANTTQSVPNPQSVGHLNLDEGFVPDSEPAVPNAPGVTDYILLAAVNKSFQPWKFSPVPDDVDVITAICFQFYHNGDPGTVGEFYLFDVENTPSVLLQTIRLNLNTSGNEAVQVVFDDFGTLSKDKFENYIALHMKMLTQGISGGNQPENYDPNWAGA